MFKIKKRKFVNAAIAVMASLALSVVLFIAVDNMAFAALMSCYILVFLLLFCNYKKNITMLAFLIVFFAFLIGRPFAYEILGYSGYTVVSLGEEMRTFVYICLLISLVSVVCGYLIYRAIKSSMLRCNAPREKYAKTNNENTAFAVKKISKSATVIFYVLAIIENIARFFYIRSVGYTNSYVLENGYNLPYGLHYLVILAPVALALFLATLPNRREMMFPVLLFVTSNLIYSLAGNRFAIVSCLLAIMVYCVWRSSLDNKRWVNKRWILCAIALVPLAMTLMQYTIYWREGRDVKTSGNPVVSFLYSVGGSSYIIGAVEENNIAGGGTLRDDVLYSFGNIWRGLNGNIIAKMSGFDVSYRGQTVESANEAHSLSDALTYYYAPKQYLSGYGLGGCYIAELYHDFSMFGVIIGNILVGIVLGVISRLEKDRIVHNFLCFFLLMLFMRLPRDSFDYPIKWIFSLNNLLFFAIVFLSAKHASAKTVKLSSGM